MILNNSSSLSFNLAQKAKSCYFKFLRLYAKDFQKKLSFKSLLETSRMCSLDSIFRLQACRTLHSICFNMWPFQLATSVIARGYYNNLHQNRLFFVRHNSKKIGINSFTNRLHLLADDMNFEWLCLDPGDFDKEIKEKITCFLTLSPNPFASTPLPFNLDVVILVYIVFLLYQIMSFMHFSVM